MEYQIYSAHRSSGESDFESDINSIYRIARNPALYHTGHIFCLQSGKLKNSVSNVFPGDSFRLFGLLEKTVRISAGNSRDDGDYVLALQYSDSEIGSAAVGDQCSDLCHYPGDPVSAHLEEEGRNERCT